MRSRNDPSWDVDSVSSITSGAQAGARRGALNVSDTTLAAGCVLRGDLELKGRSRIDGKVEGEITSDGELTVGEGGQIKANIFGKVVIVHGRVEGHIKCSERLELHAGAHVNGDVLSPRVVIQDGVVFEGRCWMGEEQLRAQS